MSVNLRSLGLLVVVNIVVAGMLFGAPALAIGGPSDAPNGDNPSDAPPVNAPPGDAPPVNTPPGDAPPVNAPPTNMPPADAPPAPPAASR